MSFGPEALPGRGVGVGMEVVGGEKGKEKEKGV
jgi:hypothetical protein